MEGFVGSLGPAVDTKEVQGVRDFRRGELAGREREFYEPEEEG